MKIAYLSESHIPSREANAVHVMKMCQALVRSGHEVRLYAIQSGRDEETSDLHGYYGVEPVFAIRRHTVASRWGRVSYSVRASRDVEAWPADAVVGRDLLGCFLAARRGTPTVWDTHMGTFLDRPHWRWLFRRFLRTPGARGVMTNCAALREAIEAAVPEARGRVVAAHNGADALPQGLTPVDLGAAPGRLQVGYVGQLYPGKGLELIRAVAAAVPDVDFTIVGGNEATLAGLRRESGLPVNARLANHVPPSETPRYLLAFDVVLAPYLRRVAVSGGGDTAAWMSPLKLFEYMAAGKPIVCSDLPVLHEIITDGQDGLLVSPDDPKAWVAAIRRLQGDEAERRRLGEAARATQAARFTWDRRARAMLEMIGATR